MEWQFHPLAAVPLSNCVPGTFLVHSPTVDSWLEEGSENNVSCSHCCLWLYKSLSVQVMSPSPSEEQVCFCHPSSQVHICSSHTILSQIYSGELLLLLLFFSFPLSVSLWFLCTLHSLWFSPRYCFPDFQHYGPEKLSRLYSAFCHFEKSKVWFFYI